MERAQLRTFSPEHRHYIDHALERTKAFYGDRLLALAIFGSYARGENRLDSDLDLLIVLTSAPRPSHRLWEFADGVERPLEPEAQELYERYRISPDISPFILTREEALLFQPVYLDLVEHRVVVCDREGLLARIVTSVRKLIETCGAERMPAGAGWAWKIGKFLGGTPL